MANIYSSDEDIQPTRVDQAMSIDLEEDDDDGCYGDNQPPLNRPNTLVNKGIQELLTRNQAQLQAAKKAGAVKVQVFIPKNLIFIRFILF